MKRTRTIIPKNKSGIYQIKSIIDNRIYIGSSIDLKARKRYHFWNLSKKEHHSKYLQRYYNKYGKENLKFSILEFCCKENLIEREQYWLNLLSPEFNMCKIAGNCLGHKVSEKTKRKISKSLIGRPGIKGRKHTQETKIKIGLAGIGRIPPNKGISMPEERKQKIKEANIKYWNSKEGKERATNRQNIWWASEKGLAKKEKLRNCFMTEEIKLKISNTLKKRNNGHN